MQASASYSPGVDLARDELAQKLRTGAKQLAAKAGIDVRPQRAADDEYRTHRDRIAETSASLLQAMVEAGRLADDLPERPERLNLIADLIGTTAAEGLAIVDGLHRSTPVGGDVCEFGVAQGATSALIANEIAPGDRQLHLFDSFEGLPAPTEQDQLIDDIDGLGSMQAYEGKMSNPVELVRSRLAAIGFPASRTTIHAGFFADEAPQNQRFPSAVSFAYVDFDFYQPILDALVFLDKVTSAGSIIIVDDYDFFSSGAKQAVDEFVAERSSRYTSVPADPAYGHFAVVTRTSDT